MACFNPAGFTPAWLLRQMAGWSFAGAENIPGNIPAGPASA
jgi:hypothetical protein